jgi:hypothetical protein
MRRSEGMFSKATRAGLLVGLAASLIGAAVLLFINPLAALIFISTEVAVMYSIYSFVIKPQMGRKYLTEHGKPAQATILEINDTGWTINQSPQVRFVLEVQPEEGEPYKAELKSVINRLDVPQFQPGTKLKVMVDPANPQHLAIAEAYSGAGGEAVAALDSGAIQKEQLQKHLEALEVASEAIRQKGQEAPAKIILGVWMGVNVNGDNPLMHFLLEVQPPGTEPFAAEATGVIKESSKSRYEPGQLISVKYDPEHPERVSLFHS